MHVAFAIAVVVAALALAGAGVTVAVAVFRLAASLRQVAAAAGGVETAYQLGRRRRSLEDTGGLRVVREDGA